MNWQLKLGIIVPSWNTVMEYEFQRMAGPTISVHSQRIKHTDDSEQSLQWPGHTGPWQYFDQERHGPCLRCA